MSDEPPQLEPDAARQSAQEHLCLLDQPLVSAYLGAAVALTAARYGKTPEEVCRNMLEQGAFGEPGDWPALSERWGRLERNCRRTYRRAGVFMEPRRPQG